MSAKIIESVPGQHRQKSTLLVKSLIINDLSCFFTLISLFAVLSYLLNYKDVK